MDLQTAVEQIKKMLPFFSDKITEWQHINYDALSYFISLASRLDVGKIRDIIDKAWNYDVVDLGKNKETPQTVATAIVNYLKGDNTPEKEERC